METTDLPLSTQLSLWLAYLQVSASLLPFHHPLVAQTGNGEKSERRCLKQLWLGCQSMRQELLSWSLDSFSLPWPQWLFQMFTMSFLPATLLVTVHSVLLQRACSARHGWNLLRLLPPRFFQFSELSKSHLRLEQFLLLKGVSPSPPSFLSLQFSPQRELHCPLLSYSSFLYLCNSFPSFVALTGGNHELISVVSG